MKVIGVKYFFGTVDGTPHDTGQVFVEEMLDFRRGTAKGCASTTYRLPSSREAKQLMVNEFPLDCDVEIVNLTNGKGGLIPHILSIKPSKALAGSAAPDSDTKSAGSKGFGFGGK